MLEKLDAFPGAGRRRLPELLVHLVELVPLVVSDAFRGPVDKLPGEQRLGGEQVADVRRRQGGNDEPAARLELDEPLALQREQALANRRGTEVEFLGDALLPDELTRAQAAAHDQFADMARHLVTELLSRRVAALCVAVDHLLRFLPDEPGVVSWALTMHYRHSGRAASNAAVLARATDMLRKTQKPETLVRWRPTALTAAAMRA